MTNIVEARISDSIVVHRYSELHRDALYKFAAKMWPHKRRRREEQYIRWKFRGPENGPIDGLLLAMTHEGQMVGQLGLIPAVLRLTDGDQSCQWSCDLMVDSDFRKRGVASKLFDSALSRNIITLGSNPSPGAEATMVKAGFQLIPGPWAMVMPIEPAEVFRWKLPSKFTVAAAPLGWLAKPLAAGLRRRLWSRSGPRAEACNWPDLLDLVITGEDNFTNPHVKHDRSFLQWRCSGFGGFSPPLCAARTTGGGYAFFGRSGDAVKVYDWHARNSTDCLALFRTIYRSVDVSRVTYFMAMAQSSEEKSWLQKLGFIAMRRRVQIISHPPGVLPNRFRYALYDSDGDI